MGWREGISAFGAAGALLLGLTACGGPTKADGTARTDTAAVQPAAAVASPLQANALGRQELVGVRRMVGGLLDGVNAHDITICTRFYTRRYRESLMGRKEPGALKECRRQARRAKFQASLVGIERLHLRRSSSGELTGQVQLVERIGAVGLLRAHFGVIRTSSGYLIDSGHGEQIAGPAPPGTTG